MERIIAKKKSAIDKMRFAGHGLAQILEDVRSCIVPGIDTLSLDSFIESRMRSRGLKPSCIGYAGYKHATLISVNDVVVHGVPSKEIILKSGDFVKIDVVGSFKGYCADMARCFFVGEVDPIACRLASVAQKALDAAIENIAPGALLSNISSTIQDVVEKEGFGVVRDFAGHGIGKFIHEAPTIPNYRDSSADVILREGMTLAIEPMITEKSYEVSIMSDGWTARTIDGGLAAHIEDTVAVTAYGVEVLTRI